jgi:fucose permease
VGNAGYGLGAVICPLAIVLVRPKNFPIIFAGIAVLALILTTLNRGLHAPPHHTEELQVRISAMKQQRRPILVTFIVAYILYVAIETGSAGWMATQLHGEGYSQSAGIFVTTGFWGGMAIGRSLGGPLYHWLSDRRLVLGGLAFSIVVLGAAFPRDVAPYAYPLLGLILASVFPMGLMWYSTLCPNDSDGISWLILFMMVGGVGGPGALSIMVSIFGVHVVPLTIAAFAALDLAVFLSALRFRAIVAN